MSIEPVECPSRVISGRAYVLPFSANVHGAGVWRVKADRVNFTISSSCSPKSLTLTSQLNLFEPKDLTFFCCRSHFCASCKWWHHRAGDMHDNNLGAKGIIKAQADLARKKAALREEKEGKYRQKLTGLQERIKKLDKSALLHRKARYETLLRMAELQESEEAFNLQRLEYERETWEMERGFQLEKMRRQLMNMRPVEELRKKLEDEQRLRLRRLDAIEDEKKRRWREKENLLKISLDKAKHLQDHAGGGHSGKCNGNESTKMREEDDPITNALEAGIGYEGGEHGVSVGCGGPANSSGLAMIAAEIDVIRRREARERGRAHDALRRKLNEERFLLAGEMDSLDLKMQQVLNEQACGLKALAQGELGPAAFQILATPAPPEATSTWVSASESRRDMPQSNPSEPKRHHGGGIDNSLDGDEGHEEVVEEEKAGGAKEGIGVRLSHMSAAGGDYDEKKEALEDTDRAAMIEAFLRAGSGSEGGAVASTTASNAVRHGVLKRRKAQAAVNMLVDTGEHTNKKERVAGAAPPHLQGSSSLSGDGDQENERADDKVRVDIEKLTSDLKAREKEAVLRIEALQSQADALVQEREWLATVSLEKGLTQKEIHQGEKHGGNSTFSPHHEFDRESLAVSNKAMEEEARLAKTERELLESTATILNELIAEEIKEMYVSLKTASKAAQTMVASTLISSAWVATARPRIQGTTSISASTPTKGVPTQPQSWVGRDFLYSALDELLATRENSARKAPQGPGAPPHSPPESVDGGGSSSSDLDPMFDVPGRSTSDAVVLRVKDIQPRRPMRKEHPAGEKYYFSHLSAEGFSVALPKGDGLVTAIAVGPANTGTISTATAAAASTSVTRASGASIDRGSSSSGGTYLLAAGTSKGGIAVWAVPHREVGEGPGGDSKKKAKDGRKISAATLVRVASPSSMPKDDRCSVERVKFGIDGHSQVVSLDNRRTVKVWDIGGGRDAVLALQGSQARGGVARAATRDFLPNMHGMGGGVGGSSMKFQALPLKARWTIRQDDLTRPLLDPKIASWLETRVAASQPAKETDAKENKAGTKKKKGEDNEMEGTKSSKLVPSAQGASTGRGGGASWPASTKRDVAATTVAFHTALTAFGDQMSVMVGMNGGSLVKCNEDAWARATATTADEEGDGRRVGAGVVYGRCAVNVEPAERGLPHEAAVLRNNTPGEVDDGGGGRNLVRREFFERHRHPIVFVGFRDHVSLSMVTLDASGLLCLWPYSADAFSGFGWYKPSQEVVVDVTLQTYNLVRPKIGRGKGKPDFIFNRALPPSYSDTSNPAEVLEELRTEGYKLWSTSSTPNDGRMDTHLAVRGDGRDSTGEDGLLPAILMRYDLEGQLKSAARSKASASAREGKVVDAKLTVSGGELAVLATYQPLLDGGGRNEADDGDRTSRAGNEPLSTAMVFLLDLESLRLLPQHIRHDWAMPDKQDSFPTPVFAVSPVLDATGSDYVYLAIGDTIRIFSFETGREMALSGSELLSTNPRGGHDASQRRTTSEAAAAITAAGTKAPIIAAEITPDHGTLAVATATSGAVTLFRLKDNSMAAPEARAAKWVRTELSDSDSEGNILDEATPWRKLLRGFACNRREATPWELRVHLSVPFPREEFRDFGHRNEIRQTIVCEAIVEAAMDLSEKRKMRQYLPIKPVAAGGNSSVSTRGGHVSLRSLLGKPPYGTV